MNLVKKIFSKVRWIKRREKMKVVIHTIQEACNDVRGENYMQDNSLLTKEETENIIICIDKIDIILINWELGTSRLLIERNKNKCQTLESHNQ